MGFIYLYRKSILNMKYTFLGIIIILLFLPIDGLSSSGWQRKVVNYERNQYKAGFQNWAITQRDNGWIYAANSSGLLEFDGVNWSLYTVRNNIVRSVKAIGNRIYVGGSSEFGYFEANNRGLLVYNSLSQGIEDYGGEVWNILEYRDRIYFLSDRTIHIYNNKNKQINSIDAKTKIDCSTLYGDKVYIGSSDGIFYLNKNDVLEFLPVSDLFKGKKLVSLITYNNNILVTTAQFGLYIIEGDNISKVKSIADNFINNNQLFSTSVSGSKVALGSVQKGFFIFDLKNPSYKEVFNLDNGLKNNTILNSYFDKDQNLWLGLDKGISYIDLNSPMRPLFATVSPIGTGYCSAKYNNELYLGTNQGLYKLNKDGGYTLIEGSEGQIWSLTVIDNTLFSSGDNGIIVLGPAGKYKIDLPGVWEIYPLSADKNRLIVGTYSSFSILEKKNKRWVFSHRVPNFNGSARGFVEDEESYNFWIVNASRQIQRVTFDTEFNKLINQKIYPLKGSSIGENSFFRKVDNNLIICAQDGIYQYSRITDRFDHYAQLESMLEGPRYYEYLSVDSLKNIWFVSDNNLKLLPYVSGEYKSDIYNWGLSDELVGNYESVHIIDSASAIVSVDNAFLKIDFSKKGLPNRPVNTYIRKIVSLKNDSIVSYGNTEKQIFIPYSQNSISIHFAATDFPSAPDIQYSYTLKGLDEEWSVPSANTLKEYTNLPVGKYLFEVRAVVNGSRDSAITEVEFTITPPWYRSALAYILYSLLAVVLLFILYKKTIGKQKKIIYQKGEELVAQTKRHEEENKIKDQAIYQLQNDKLQTELHFKTQELTGYILNVIRKNEILEDVKKDALAISKAIDDEKNLNSIRQKVMRLISQINSNIDNDDDFEVFKSNFNLVHQDFFELLDDKFPGLSRNDKILCAYLNMNLSTKEIAPMLNISVRGVEVNRYRLRKKMNLDRDVNLSEYLQSL